MAKFPKSKNGARKRAEHAEALADQVEALPMVHGAMHHMASDPKLSAETVAMLMVNEPYTVIDDHRILDANGKPPRLPALSFVLGMLNVFHRDDIVTAIRVVEHVFPDWGWDLIRWPKDATQIEGADGSFIHDAEITPYGGSLLGRDLIGQHKIMTCALWAAALRARAYQIRVEAGILEPLVNPMPPSPAPRDAVFDEATEAARKAIAASEPEEQP